MRSMARAAPQAPHAAHIVHAAHAAAGGGGGNGGDGAGCSGEGDGEGGCSSCCCCCSCGCCRSSAFSSSFCRSRLYPLPLKHVAASTAARFNFSFADGCFNVWSPCHLFVHALSSLQVANAQCMTLRSLAPCLRAARKKHRFAAGKKTSEQKNTFGSRKKTLCSGKKLFPQREKTPAKNAASQREKFQAAEKTPCSSTKAPLQQKKCILEAAGKNRPRREKIRPRREKTGRGRKKTSAAEKVELCNPKSCRNGKNTFPQREKAAAQPQVVTRRKATGAGKKNKKRKSMSLRHQFHAPSLTSCGLFPFHLSTAGSI